MQTQVEIDLNVRDGDRTFAGFEHILWGVVPNVGDVVEVVQPEMSVYGKAEIVDVDASRQLIFLKVNWAELAIETRSQVQAFPTLDGALAGASVESATQGGTHGSTQSSWQPIGKVQVRRNNELLLT